MTMKPLCLAFATAVALALPAAYAQTAAPPAPPADAASVAPKAPPDKRNLTPTEARDSAPTAGDLRPQQSRVAPQISIPLNNKGGQVPLKGLVSPPPRATPKPAGGVDDSAARCTAIADAQAREQCRDKLR